MRSIEEIINPFIIPVVLVPCRSRGCCFPCRSATRIACGNDKDIDQETRDVAHPVPFSEWVLWPLGSFALPDLSRSYLSKAPRQGNGRESGRNMNRYRRISLRLVVTLRCCRMKRNAVKVFQTDLFTFMLAFAAFDAPLQDLSIVESKHAFVANPLRQFVDAHNAGQKGSCVCVITHEDLAKRKGDLKFKMESTTHTERERVCVCGSQSNSKQERECDS